MNRRDFLKLLEGSAALLFVPYEPKVIYSFPTPKILSFADLLTPDLRRIYLDVGSGNRNVSIDKFASLKVDQWLL